MEENVPIREIMPQEDDEDTKISDDTFITYVEQQIAYMEGFLKIGAGKEINFYELEEALKGYTHVHLSLLAMYNVARFEHMKQEEEFAQWYAEKLVYIRDKYNLTEKSAQKWASQRELDALLRKDFSSEFQPKKASLLTCDQKHSFLGQLVKMWEGYSYILNTLSTNVRAELGTANFDNHG